MRTETTVMPTRVRLNPTTRCLGLLGLRGALVLPSTGAAAIGHDRDRAESVPAMDECAESAVVIQIDTLDGGIYMLDPQTGDMNRVENEIPVYFGGRSQLVVELEYTAGDWEVEVSSQGGTEETVGTTNGTRRYVLELDNGDYVFTTNEDQRDASTMMNMAPVPPGEIIIMPEPTCPPED